MNPAISFGCSTFCCMDQSLDEALDKIRQRTERIEIVSEGLHDLFRNFEACHSVRARYSVHAPLTDINLASVNERIRKAGLAVIDDLCGICDSIHAETIVVHPGYFPWLSVKDASYSALLNSLDDLNILQKEYDVRICIENMGSWECCHFRTPDLLPELRQRNLGFVLDAGHAHLNKRVNEFLENSIPDHLHLHDNSGSADDHNACGNGTIDFSAILSRVPASVSRIIECRDLAAYDRGVAFLSVTGGNHDGRSNPDAKGEK
jgi:sugar phosphate isomerase/epimerase